MTAGTSPGARAYFAWALGSLFFFYAFVQRVAPSVMVEDMMRDFAVGGAIVGHLSAFYFYAYAGLQIPVGVMMDRFGPRRLMSAAALICGIGGVMFAMSSAVEGAYLGRLLVGAGVGFGWVGTLTVIAQWFPAHRFALLTGFTQLAGMAGGVFGQAPLAASVAEIGWRTTMAAVAVVALGMALALWLVVRDRPHVAARGSGLLSGLASAVRQRETWFNAFFGMSMTGPMLSFAGLWGVPFIMGAYGLDRPSAGATTSVMFIGWGIGAPTLGWLSDKIHRRKALMLACGACAVTSFVAAIYLPGLPLGAVKVLLLVHGFFASGMVLSFAAAREHNVAAASGAALGLVNAAVVGSGALLQPLIGWLLDLQWDGSLAAGARIYASSAYTLAFAVIPALGLAGTAAVLATRETYCRQQA